MRRLRFARLVLTFLAFGPCAGCLTSQAIGFHSEWRKLIADPKDKGLSAERVEFRSEDGLTLSAWWIPATGSPRGTVVLVHGMSGNRSYMLGRAAFLVAARFNVLALDLRAHGESEGAYMTPGWMEAKDVLGGLRYGRTRDARGPFVLMGYSYGAVAVLHAAARTEATRDAADAVIADAAFMSAVDVMHRIADLVGRSREVAWPARMAIGLVKWPGVLWLMNVEFFLRTGVYVSPRKVDAIRVVRRIQHSPILFLAGQRDPLAPAENTGKLFDATPAPRKRLVILPGATHATYTEETKGVYETAVRLFLDDVLAAPPGL